VYTRTEIFPIKLDAVYLNKNKKMGYEKNITETTHKEKLLERRHWVTPHC
jgi:hypothetical protein